MPRSGASLLQIFVLLLSIEPNALYLSGSVLVAVGDKPSTSFPSHTTASPYLSYGALYLFDFGNSFHFPLGTLAHPHPTISKSTMVRISYANPVSYTYCQPHPAKKVQSNH